jgi:hypothetical protein
MFGKNPRLNPLQLRKQLLLAESELNRLQMVSDLDALRESVHALGARAKSFRSVASSAAMLVAGLAAFQRGKPAANGAKPSWLKTVLKGAGLVSSLWLAFRSQNPVRDDN